MVLKIYGNAFKVLMKKPIRLWGISLLSGILSFVFSVLFGAVIGVSLAIGMLFTTSMTMIFLYGYRGQEVKAVDIFSCFKDWGTIKRVLCGMGWMMLWIFIWSLIPIVGPIFAIIRTYEYRLTPYILVQEPNIAPTEAIKVSKARTMGYKASMFLADFLFGLAFGVVALVLTLLGLIPYVGVLFAIVLFVVSVLYALFANLFLGLVQAAFYEEINNAAVCPQCGARIDDKASFCGKCGCKLN
ncbi:MAG: zinc-ribbon domain-containing protein [Clostridia bacterium]|nr:zinc-ribbon domain-containing protein [Clostridia bacterium]